MLRSLLGCICLFLVLGARTSEAQFPDHSLEWRTFETPHFRIHYHQPLEEAARHTAAVLEHAQTTLGPLLNHTPSGPVEVVLSDPTDSANGSAATLPYNLMRLYLTAPEDLTPLGDYDDWLTELIVHEHTHILHLDTIGGIPSLLNRVFGRTFAPNQIQPRWFIEGLAVVHESEQTTAGRLRSTMFEMYMRMEVLGDQFLRLDQISNGVSRWPYGNVAYLYGSRFCSFIAREHGIDALTAMSQDYGRQLIPYALNRTAERATGHSFVDLYQQFETTEAAYHRGVAQSVRERGLREGQRLTHHGGVALSPRFLNDEDIVYYRSDGALRPQIRRISIQGNEPEREISRSSGSSYLSPVRAQDSLILSQRSPVDNAYRLTDLYRLDATNGEIDRLTYGLRAMEPDVSYDGNRLAFVRNSAGTRHLFVADLEDIANTQEILIRNHRFDQVYTPRFSPDGQWIAFSQWSRGGYRDIHVINVETGERRQITDDRAIDTGPAWSPDGSTLYFSSDRTGIANLYAYSWVSNDIQQVTNVIGGAYQPSVAPNGESIVYLGYGSAGFDLYWMPLDPSLVTPATPAPPRETAHARPEPFSGESVPYRAMRTLWPRAYTLSWDNDTFGRALGISVAGNDAVGNHAMSASVSVSLEEGYTSGAASYSFLGSRVPFTVSGFRIIQARGGLQIEGRNRLWSEQAIGGSLSLQWSRIMRLQRFGLSAGYSLTHGSKAEAFGGRLDPNDPPPRLPYLGLRSRWRLSTSYSNTLSTSQDISPSEGQRLGLSISYAEPHLGSPFREFDAQWSLTQYLELPWSQHQVLAMRYGGGLSLANRRRYPYQLGGFPSPDLISTLLTGASFGGVALRGYAPGTLRGDRFHLLQVEYRLPLLRANRGLGTFPLYIGRIHGILFTDIGTAYPRHQGFHKETLRGAIGAELHSRLSVGYHLQLMLRLGVAYGFSQDGGLQLYLNLGTGF